MSQARRLVQLLQSDDLQFDGGALAGCIAWHRRKLAMLEQQQRDELFRLMVESFPQVISAAQVWQVPELRAVCIEAGLTTIKHVGYWLRSWSGSKLARLDRDELGTFWKPEDEIDLHADASIVVDDDV